MVNECSLEFRIDKDFFVLTKDSEVHSGILNM